MGRHRLAMPFALLGVLALSTGALHALHGDAAQGYGSHPHAACAAEPAPRSGGGAPGDPHAPHHSPDDCPICLLIRADSSAPVHPPTTLAELTVSPEPRPADGSVVLPAKRFEVPAAPRAPPALS